MMYICLCNAVCEKEVKDFIKENPTSNNSEIIKKLKIGSSCNSCVEGIEKTIDKIREGKALLDPFDYVYDESILE